MLPANRTAFPFASTWSGPSNRIESFANRFVGEDGWPLAAAANVPAAVWEDEDNYFAELDLPGVAEGDVDLTVHDGVLWIRCERKPVEGRRYLYNARGFGRIERMIRLPGPIDAGAVQATMASGVLRLTLPKSAEAKPRKIAVRPA